MQFVPAGDSAPEASGTLYDVSPELAYQIQYYEFSSWCVLTNVKFEDDREELVGKEVDCCNFHSDRAALPSTFSTFSGILVGKSSIGDGQGEGVTVEG